MTGATIGGAGIELQPSRAAFHVRCSLKWQYDSLHAATVNQLKRSHTYVWQGGSCMASMAITLVAKDYAELHTESMRTIFTASPYNINRW